MVFADLFSFSEIGSLVNLSSPPLNRIYYLSQRSIALHSQSHEVIELRLFLLIYRKLLSHSNHETHRKLVLMQVMMCNISSTSGI